MIDTIVYVYDQAYISGGAAKIAINAAIALKEKGYRVIYFAAVGPIEDSLLKSGIEVIVIGGEHIAKTKSVKTLYRGIWNNYAKEKLSELLSSLDSEKTVVHVHGWTKSLSASIFDACHEHNMKTFITLHEYFTICGNGGVYNYNTGEICNCKPGSVKCFLCNCDKRNYLQKIYRNIRQIKTNKSLLRNRPNLIYITEFSKDVIKPYIKIESNDYFVENHVNIKSKEKIQVKENSLYLFIGRMSKEKAPELFCEAVTQSKVKGVVIGDGPQLDNLKENYADVEFTGWLDSEQMEEYIQRARCLIVTSKWYETMGLTIIEMQARGIPCIVPDKCAGKEYIDDKRNGVIYKIGDLKDLVSKIEITKDNNRIKEWGDNFYNCYDEQRFSMDRHIKKLVEVYES